MNILHFLQPAIAFGMGITGLYTVYTILNRYLRRVIDLQETNMAYATLQTGVILSTSVLMSSVVGPMINALRFLNQTAFDLRSLGFSLAYLIFFQVIGTLFAMLTVAGGLLTIFQLTKVNEWEEIKQNKVSTALIAAALIVGLSIIMRDNVATICEGLIPYPEVLQIR
jgi:uncharacterized membrane protein YjfL (UPF0719 family)